MHDVLKHLSLFLALALGVAAQGSITAYAGDRIDQVKAVFLFKFSDYITWPADMQPTPGGMVSLCIWGKNPFGDTLDIIARKQTNYDYHVRYYALSVKPQNCHLLFSAQADDTMLDIHGPLLISDKAGFARSGGMMEMTERSGKVKLTINLKAAENAGYKISARLLDIADVIR